MLTRILNLSHIVRLHLVMLVVLQSAGALAQSGNPTAPAPSPAEDFIQKMKKPVSWANWGSDLRVRNEYFNDILTLNSGNALHEQDYFRFRARLWGTVTPLENLSLNARVATEPREWLRRAGYTPFKGRSGLDWSEGVFDAVNVQWRNIYGQPITLTAWQDIMPGRRLARRRRHSVRRFLDRLSRCGPADLGFSGGTYNGGCHRHRAGRSR